MVTTVNITKPAHAVTITKADSNPQINAHKMKITVKLNIRFKSIISISFLFSLFFIINTYLYLITLFF